MPPTWQPQPMAGVFLLDPFQHADDRGEFVKTLHAPTYEAVGLRFDCREEFYSISNRNVIRGMHFQKTPHAHQKIIYCITGSIIDVLVDLRSDKPTYRQAASFELNSVNRRVLWIPEGIAHGFLSLQDDTCVVYKTDHEHVPESDAGVRWDSIGFDWGIDDPTVSPRDQNLPMINEFDFGNLESAQ